MSTVLITGASSGIGKETALYFARKGWNVAATMRSPEKETTLQQEKNIQVIRLDVTDAESIRLAFDQAEQAFGPIDVVVNNAGYGLDGVFEAMTDEDLKKQFDTNVFGLMRVTREAIGRMRPRKQGTIIQIASVGGRTTFPLYSVYHSTKWAVEGFSESLQYELRQFNIKVRIIEPGAIKTEFYTGSRKFVRPDFTKEYDEMVDKCDKLSMETGEKGASPESVARKIFEAANRTDWKMRFPIAYPANVILPMRRFLPDFITFWFTRMSYKI